MTPLMAIQDEENENTEQEQKMNFWEFADKHSVGLAWTIITIIFLISVLIESIAKGC